MDDDRWPKQIMYSWITDWPRPKGKPKQRWRDAVNRDLKALGLKDRWYEMTAKREEWRAAIHKREQTRFEEEERREAEKIRDFVCVKCAKKCKSQNGLKGHMTRKHRNMCQKCGTEFENQKSLWSHSAKCKEKRKEKEEEKEKRKEKIESDDEWEYHGKRKQSAKPSSSLPGLPPVEHRCSICETYVAKNRTGLLSHIRHHHPDGKPSPSMQIPSSSAALSAEVAPTAPPSSKVFQCRFCPFTCNSQIGRWKHENTTHKTSTSTPPTSITTTPTSDLSVPSSLTKGLSPLHRPPDDDPPPG